MSNMLVRTAATVFVLALVAIGTGFLVNPVWGWSLFSLGLIGLLATTFGISVCSPVGLALAYGGCPEGRGAWEEVFTLLYRRQRAETARSRQLAHSLARSRQPAGRFPTASRSWTPNTHRLVQRFL